jgi:hypothetical protein
MHDLSGQDFCMVANDNSCDEINFLTPDALPWLSRDRHEQDLGCGPAHHGAAQGKQYSCGARPAIVRRRWSLMLEQCELQGMPCIALDLAPAGNQKIGWLVYSSNRSRI